MFAELNDIILDAIWILTENTFADFFSKRSLKFWLTNTLFARFSNQNGTSFREEPMKLSCKISLDRKSARYIGIALH